MYKSHLFVLVYINRHDILVCYSVLYRMYQMYLICTLKIIATIALNV